MDEAVSVRGLRGGTHKPTGYALERVLGSLVFDSDLCGPKAEERPVASDGKSTTTAVLVERIPRAGVPAFRSEKLRYACACLGIALVYADTYPSAIKCPQDDFDASIQHMAFPPRHQQHILTTNRLRRAFVEQKRRTNIIPASPMKRAI